MDQCLTLAFLAFPFFSTEKVKLSRIEGQAKVVGTVVCVFGAILMAVFRGPALVGHDAKPNLGSHDDIRASAQLEPSHWFVRDIGLDDWHIGILCLIGNCICMAAFIAIQVR